MDISDTSYALTRARPPWPGVLPLSEAAPLLGVKQDTLYKRLARRKQPGYSRGGRTFILLLPHQWAAWAQGYQPPLSERLSEKVQGVDSVGHQPRTDGSDRRPTTGAEGTMLLLQQLEASRIREDEARQREAAATRRSLELAGQVGYWQGRALAAEERVLSDPSGALSDTPARTLLAAQPAPVSLWQRLWARVTRVPLPRTVLAPAGLPER